MILRLANNDGVFICRVSAILLMTNIYPRAGEKKYHIRQKFIELCSEETPMVRRIIATKIGVIYILLYISKLIYRKLVDVFK